MTGLVCGVSAAFQCHGGWQENGRNYLITGLKGSKAKFCFVFSEADKVTQLSGLHDTCRRTVLPGVTGNLTFNISAAGECDFQPSGAPRPEEATALWSLLALVLALLRLSRWTQPR